MSKVFIVRFHVIQFTRYSVRSALAVSFYILAHRKSFVKNFFQVFSIFFAVFVSFMPPLRTALIYYQIFPALSSFIFIFFHFLLRLFFHFLPRVWGAYFPPRTAAIAGMVYEPQGMMRHLPDPARRLSRRPEPMISAVP